MATIATRYRTFSLNILDSQGKSHERDRHQALKRLVSEVYSPPRITLEIMRGGFRNLTLCLALDLTIKVPDDGMPLDFFSKFKRIKARELLRHSQPVLLIGSPMRTAFSTWQRLNAAKSRMP